jgi:hypothetical protein
MFWPLLTAEEVMGMRRYPLVLDTDLPIRDEELHQGPVSYLGRTCAGNAAPSYGRPCRRA